MFPDKVEDFQLIHKIFTLSGKFLDCLENFPYFIENFPDCLESFPDCFFPVHLESLDLSGKFLDKVKYFQLIRKLSIFSIFFKDFLDSVPDFM